MNYRLSGLIGLMMLTGVSCRQVGAVKDTDTDNRSSDSSTATSWAGDSATFTTGGDPPSSDGNTDSSHRDTESTDTGIDGSDETETAPPDDTATWDSENDSTGPLCGNGMLDDWEACDDGNWMDGDGCSADCLIVETGWCVPPETCHRIARCGDGELYIPELCDDGNGETGDGCDAECFIELGWNCTGTPSSCFHTTCGDGKVEGAEDCDDGNTHPFDGCDQNCQVEPDCTAGVCLGRCGDGIVDGSETCDDGWQISGDGCTADCQIEAGYVCAPAVDEPVLVSALFRDFSDSVHPDFAVIDFTEEEVLAGGCVAASPGLLQKELSATGKPVLDEGYTKDVGNSNPEGCDHIQSPSSFAEWYLHSVAHGLVTSSQLVLQRNAAGAYVSPVIEGAAGDAGISAEDAGVLNYFTSEMRFRVRYNSVAAQRILVEGNDDIWVFVAGRLAIDLGGMHGTLEGSVRLSDIATSHDLQDGSIYEVVIFQAERGFDHSRFVLTLNGFDSLGSTCASFCGDGIVSAIEECDAGAEYNTGGYGECTFDCKLGPYCGDGILQTPYELCDDGNNRSGDDCPPSCIHSVIE